MVPPLRDALCTMRADSAAAADALFPYFAQFVLDRYMAEIRQYR